MKYKGIFRLRTPIDTSTNTFPREYTGQFADNDVYIDCQKNVQIFSFGRGILQAYIPSIGRGNNIIKAIQSDLGYDVIFDIEKSDSEVLFKFNAKSMEQLVQYLKPKTNGADRSPFSTKNLPKTKYDIPDEDLYTYKSIVSKLPRERLIDITHSTNDFIKSLATKKNTLDDIKADMSLKGLKAKEYIHSIGKWNDYIDYLKGRLG